MSTANQIPTEDSGYQLKGNRPDNYERWWVPALMGACAEDLVDAACLRDGDKVLDVACGTGVVARAVALRQGTQASVTGADINDDMIETAQRHTVSEGLGKIQWRTGDAANLPFESSEFNVALCQQGLQFMPNRIASLREIARVLVPGGRLVASVWKSGSPFGTALRKALGNYFGEKAVSDWTGSISLGDRREFRSLAEEAGFIKCHVKYDVKIGRHCEPDKFISGVIEASSLSGNFSNLPVKEQGILVRSVFEDLKNYIDDDGLAYPAECHTITAQTPGNT